MKKRAGIFFPVFALSFSSILSTSYSDMYETQELPAPLPIHSGKSANYQKYQQLLQGN